MKTAAVVLAAGKGTRMKSDLPKVLHKIDGRSMVSYVVDTIRGEGCEPVCVVVGYRKELVEDALADSDVRFVLQEEQLGTGHAVLQCEDALAGFHGTVMVLNGDVPGLRAETIRSFRDFHNEHHSAATVLSAIVPDPTGYGRIVKDDAGAIQGIVEEKDASDDVRGIAEINSGLFCFDKDKLFEAIKVTGRDNAQGEYYLTDVIALLKNAGDTVMAYCIEDAREVAGVNTEAELEAIRKYMME